MKLIYSVLSRPRHLLNSTIVRPRGTSECINDDMKRWEFTVSSLAASRQATTADRSTNVTSRGENIPQIHSSAQHTAAHSECMTLYRAAGSAKLTCKTHEDRQEKSDFHSFSRWESSQSLTIHNRVQQNFFFLPSRIFSPCHSFHPTFPTKSCWIIIVIVSVADTVAAEITINS